LLQLPDLDERIWVEQRGFLPHRAAWLCSLVNPPKAPGGERATATEIIPVNGGAAHKAGRLMGRSTMPL
jgi:hypothetical protein